MKKLAFALLIALTFTGLTGCPGSDPAKGTAQFYNDLVYSSGREFMARFVVGGMTMDAWTGRWSAEASSEDCGGQKPATLYLDGDNYGTNDITFDCDVHNLYKVTLVNGNVTVQYSTGSKMRETVSYALPEGSPFSALSE